MKIIAELFMFCIYVVFVWMILLAIFPTFIGNLTDWFLNLWKEKKDETL